MNTPIKTMGRIPKAYLEKHGPEWLDDFVYISRNPLIDKGYKIIPFDGSDLEDSLLNKPFVPGEDIIIGSVEATIALLEANNIEVPKPMGYPKSLDGFLGREVIETTFGELGSDFPYFVKPSGRVKLFTGDVVSKQSHLGFIADDCAKDKNLSMNEKMDLIKDLPVYKSTILDFSSEYRCFITNGTIRGIKHYTGQFDVFPDMRAIREMVKAFEMSGEAPMAYTLDVGIAYDDKTYLVELNDMWAIGSYGLDGVTYSLLCARRFKQICRENIKE